MAALLARLLSLWTYSTNKCCW